MTSILFVQLFHRNNHIPDFRTKFSLPAILSQCNIMTYSFMPYEMQNSTLCRK